MKTVKIENALRLNKVKFIDVRTEKEYNEDNILDALNIPLFNDDEYHKIGTIYKKKGKHEAIEKGFDYISYKLKDMYLKITEIINEYDNVVIYCSRGGMRSGSLVSLLSSLGLDIYQLEGGYKAYRNFVLDYFKGVMDTKKFISVHGLTGVGKTDLLKELEKRDIDILDLEGAAKNSGSTFGFITFDEKPPTQKSFETKIFESLFFSNTNYIFVESESRRVGHVLVPIEIYESMTTEGYRIILEGSLKSRIDRLCRDYIYTKGSENIEVLKDCINKFRKRLGNKTVEEYIDLLELGKYEELVERYLVDYYDPLYMYSVEKYKYDKHISSDDIDKIVEEVIKFQKAAVEGAI